MDNIIKPSIPASDPSAVGSQPVFAEPALRKVDWGGWSRVKALLASVPAAAIATAVWSPAAVWSQGQPGEGPDKPILILSTTDNTTVLEGDSGRKRIRITASVSPAVEVPVRPQFSFAFDGDGTQIRVGHCGQLQATPDADICGDHQPGDIPPGGSVDYDIYVLGDNRHEGNETLDVGVSAFNTNGTRNYGVLPSDDKITITIQNDDAEPDLAAIGDVTVQPGQTVNVTAAAVDADGDTISYAWSRKRGETTPALPRTTALNQAKLTFTPPLAREGGTYTMTVTANDGHGNTDTEDVTITVTAPPPAAPAAFYGTQAGNGQVTLGWQRGETRITKYQYQQNGGEWKNIAGSSATTTSHTVTGLTDGTPYRFKVRAVVNTTTGTASNEVTVTPSVAVTPKLTVTMKDGSHCSNTPPCNELKFYDINLKWTVTNNSAATILGDTRIPIVKGWNVQWRFKGLPADHGLGQWQDAYEYVRLFSDSENRASRRSLQALFQLDNGTEVEFRVRAEGTRGLGNIPIQGPWSNVVSVTAQSRYTPLAPTSFKVYGGNQQVKLAWKNPSPAHVSAHITKWQYQQNGNRRWVDIPNSNALTTTHTVTGLTNGTPYRFKVRAVSGYEVLYSEASTEESVTPKAPVAPTLTVEPTSTVEVQRPKSSPYYASILTWTVADEAPHALVENGHRLRGWSLAYRLKGSTEWTTINRADNREVVESGSRGFIHATIRVGGRYLRRAEGKLQVEYRLRAVGVSDSDRETSGPLYGPWSNTATVFFGLNHPGAPSGFKAAAKDGKVKLTWKDPKNSEITKYQYQQDGGAWVDMAGSGATTTSYLVTGLENYRTYRFRIRAMANTLEGKVSEEVSVTPPQRTVSIPATVEVKEGTDSHAVVTIKASKALGSRFRFHLAWVPGTALSHRELHHNRNLEPRPRPGLSYTPHGEGAHGDTEYDYDDVAVLSPTISFGSNDLRQEIVFGPDDTTKKIRIPITDDGLAENSESFALELRLTDPLPVGASLGNTRTVVTILDNDHAPVLKPMEAVSVAKSQTVEIVARATDRDDNNKTLNYTWLPAHDDSNTGCHEEFLDGEEWVSTKFNKALLKFTPKGPGSCDMMVTVEDGHGNEDSQIVEIMVTGDDAPAKPANLQAEANGEEEIILFWDDPGDAKITGYEYRQKVMDHDGVMGHWIPIPGSDAETVSHTVSGLIGGKTYRYRIRALRGVAASPASNRADATAATRGTPQEFAERTVPPSPTVNISTVRKISFCEVGDDDCDSTEYKSETKGDNKLAWALDFALNPGDDLNYNPTGLEIQWLETDTPDEVSDWEDTGWGPRDQDYSSDGPTDVPWPGLIDNKRAHSLGRIVYAPLDHEISIRIRLVNEHGPGHPSQWVTFNADERLFDVSYHSYAEGAEVSVKDATAQEAEGAQLEFRVKLDRSKSQRRQSGPLRVRYFTRDVGSATAGADYTATTGYLTFQPGEKKKTVLVPVLEDEIDDNGETMELVISEIGNPWSPPTYLTDVKGTGTITNTDPIPAAWLGRFGRTVADQALDAVSDRIAAERTPGLSGSLAGQALPHVPFGSGAQEGEVVSDTTTASNVGDALSEAIYQAATASGSMSGQDLLLGTNFSLARGADAMGGNFTFWGQVAYSGFDGKEGDLSLDGEVLTGLVGLDYSRQQWMLGLAVSRSGGSGGYKGKGEGKIETTLTSAIPYGAWQASERVKLWGALGYGRGEMTLKPKEQGGEIKADLNWTMAAVGARAALLDPDGEGLSLDLLSDGLWTRTTSEKVTGLAGTEAEVTRLRLGLEGSWANLLQGGGELTPKFSLGARLDGGDAETGFGMELGGGVVWSSPGVGLSLNLDGRTLLFHEADGLKDWGFSAGLVFDPQPESQRGLSVTMGQDWGGAATGGIDALFAANPLEQRNGVEGTSRWTLEAAYGLPAFAGRFTGAPYVGMALAAGARDYTVGWRLTPEVAEQDITFEVKATRSEKEDTRPDHGVELDIRRTW